jgi:hypothetical protein
VLRAEIVKGAPLSGFHVQLQLDPFSRCFWSSPRSSAITSSSVCLSVIIAYLSKVWPAGAPGNSSGTRASRPPWTRTGPQPGGDAGNRRSEDRGYKPDRGREEHRARTATRVTIIDVGSAIALLSEKILDGSKLASRVGTIFAFYAG